MTDAKAPGFPWTPASLVSLRGDPTRRRVALVGVAVLGLGLAWLHWLGLVLAGVLLALPSRTVPRALGAALAFGVGVLAVVLLTSSTMSAGEFLGLQPVSSLSIGIALLAPAWGSLVRATI